MKKQPCAVAAGEERSKEVVAKPTGKADVDGKMEVSLAGSKPPKRGYAEEEAGSPRSKGCGKVSDRYVESSGGGGGGG
jgi:hypothetical protein